MWDSAQLAFDDVPELEGAGTDTVEFDNDFVEVERHRLDEHSWIEVVPRLVRVPEQLFALLRRELDFSQRQRVVWNRTVDEPRLTADYERIETAPCEALRILARRFSAAYGIPYDGVWVNFYRDHQDGTGWHGDWASCKRELCTVPVLTLGHPRRFLVRPTAGGEAVRFVPNSGDLIVMRGRCQLDWRHSVPKQATPAGPRISVNFQSSVQMTP